jgi:hypothetical protein
MINMINIIIKSVKKRKEKKKKIPGQTHNKSDFPAMSIEKYKIIIK